MALCWRMQCGCRRAVSCPGTSVTWAARAGAGAAAELGGVTGVWAAVKCLVTVGPLQVDLVKRHARCPPFWLPSPHRSLFAPGTALAVPSPRCAAKVVSMVCESAFRAQPPASQRLMIDRACLHLCAGGF